jgi:hypothetical protein
VHYVTIEPRAWQNWGNRERFRSDAYCFAPAVPPILKIAARFSRGCLSRARRRRPPPAPQPLVKPLLAFVALAQSQRSRPALRALPKPLGVLPKLAALLEICRCRLGQALPGGNAPVLDVGFESKLDALFVAAAVGAISFVDHGGDRAQRQRQFLSTVYLSPRRFKSEVQQCGIDGMAE